MTVVKSQVVVVVDADPVQGGVVAMLLDHNGYEVNVCTREADAWHRLMDHPVDLLFVKLHEDNWPEMHALVARVATAFAQVPVVIALDDKGGSLAERFRAFPIKAFLQLPLSPAGLLQQVSASIVHPAAEVGVPAAVARPVPASPQFSSQSSPWLETTSHGGFKRQLTRLKHRVCPILITGPAGSEFDCVVAHLAGQQVVKRVSGERFTETLGESFYDESRALMIESCDQLSPAEQEFLCTYLVGKQVRPIYFCTTADLASLEEANRFSSQLYLQLSSSHVEIPSLAGRLTDVPAMAADIYREFMRLPDASDHALIHDDVRLGLLTQAWPGNFEELVAVLARACDLGAAVPLTEGFFFKALGGTEAPVADTPSVVDGFSSDAPEPSPAHPEPDMREEAADADLLDDLRNHVTSANGAAPGFDLEKYIKFHA